MRRHGVGPLAAVLAAYVVLCVVWNAATPPHEGFDEPSHVAYVDQLLRTGGPPVLPSPSLEAHQPPAYYYVEAGLVQALHLRLPAPPDPRPVVGGHQFDHVGQCRFCDGIGTLRLMRLLTTALGLVTLVLVWLCLRLALPGGTAPLAGTAAVAFLPQFDFLSSLVNNDGLSYLAGAALILACLLLLRRPVSRARAVAAGAALGLGLLTKEYALAMTLLIPLALCLGRAGWARVVTGTAQAGVVAALVASPWLVRNTLLYGQPWPISAERANIARVLPASVVSRQPWDPVMWAILPKEAWKSFWYAGGWGQLLFPDWAYVALLLVVPLLVAGLAVLIAPQRFDIYGVHRREVVLMLAAVALMAAGLWWSALSIQQWPGRYLFPVLAGVAVLPVLGVLALVPPRWRLPGLAMLPAGALALNLAALLLVALPAYR